jgi:hypothetical protein
MKEKTPKQKSTKPTLKIRDLKTKANPVGGVIDNCSYINGTKGRWNGK